MQTQHRHRRSAAGPAPTHRIKRRGGRDFTQYMTDLAITETLESLLAGDTGIDSRRIHVETYNNTVTLTGQVASRGDKQQAGALVLNRENANGVINQLAVRPPH